MTKYLIKSGMRGMFYVNDSVDVIDYLRTNIDWMYRIPEDGVLTVRNKDDSTEILEVKKDDIVITFYPGKEVKHNVIAIHSDEFIDNINRRIEVELEDAKTSTTDEK